MKKFIALLAVAIGAAVMTPATAEARDYGGSSRAYAYSCRSCGTPVYKQRCYVGRDRHGCAMYSWRTISHSCRSSSHRGHGHSHHGHSHRGSGFFFGR